MEQIAGEYELVTRREIRPGDQVISSHYGPSTVETVLHAGTSTVEFIFGRYTIDLGNGPVVRLKNERYDAHLLIQRKLVQEELRNRS